MTAEKHNLLLLFNKPSPSGWEKGVIKEEGAAWDLKEHLKDFSADGSTQKAERGSHPSAQQGLGGGDALPTSRPED